MVINEGAQPRHKKRSKEMEKHFPAKWYFPWFSSEMRTGILEEIRSRIPSVEGIKHSLQRSGLSGEWAVGMDLTLGAEGRHSSNATLAPDRI